MEDIPSLLACDGSPAAMLTRERLKDASSVDHEILAGLFHLLLHAYRAFSGLYAHSHLRAYFGLWRPTEGQLNYVLDNPGDPDQIGAETLQASSGIFAAAIDGYIETKLAELVDAMDGPQDYLEVSAMDVFEHMVKRGKENLLVFRINTSLILASIIHMLHKSENNADAQLYLSAARLLAAPFCMQHQTSYIFLLSEFWGEWFCKSDAGKAMFTECFLFRTSRNGYPMASDRFVENGVRYVRMFTGKKSMGPGHAQTVQTATLLLDDRLRLKTRVKNEVKGQTMRTPRKAGLR